MDRSVVQQWIDELEHCQDWGNPTGVERAVEQLRSLGVEVREADGRLVAGAGPAPGPESAPSPSPRAHRRRTPRA